MLRLGGNMMKLRLECLSALAVFGGFPVGNQRRKHAVAGWTFFSFLFILFI